MRCAGKLYTVEVVYKWRNSHCSQFTLSQRPVQDTASQALGLLPALASLHVAHCTALR